MCSSKYLSFPIVFSSFVYYLHQCYLQNLPYMSHPIFLGFSRQASAVLLTFGRIGNDKGIGKLTCKNSSVVDYVISSVDFLKHIVNFSICEFTRLQRNKPYTPVEYKLYHKQHPHLTQVAL
jgi:hypothetical protein